MKLNEVLLTEQLQINEGDLPPKFLNLAMDKLGFSKQEIQRALSGLNYRNYLKLFQALAFGDFDDALYMLSKGGSEDNIRQQRQPQQRQPMQRQQQRQPMQRQQQRQPQQRQPMQRQQNPTY